MTHQPVRLAVVNDCELVVAGIVGETVDSRTRALQWGIEEGFRPVTSDTGSSPTTDRLPTQGCIGGARSLMSSRGRVTHRRRTTPHWAHAVRSEWGAVCAEGSSRE